MSVKSTLVTINKQNAKEMVKTVRESFLNGVTKPLNFRKNQLNSLLKFVTDYRQEICDAIYKDFRKPRHEVVVTEIEFLANEIRHLLMKLGKYAAPVKAKRDFANLFDGLYVYNDPYGVVLVIGAWNYPLQLVLAPAAGCKLFTKIQNKCKQFCGLVQLHNLF